LYAADNRGCWHAEQVAYLEIGIDVLFTDNADTGVLARKEFLGRD
jgi:hypothetical protein